MSNFLKLLIRFTADKDIRSTSWLAAVVEFAAQELEDDDEQV